MSGYRVPGQSVLARLLDSDGESEGEVEIGGRWPRIIHPFLGDDCRVHYSTYQLISYTMIDDKVATAIYRRLREEDR